MENRPDTPTPLPYEPLPPEARNLENERGVQLVFGLSGGLGICVVVFFAAGLLAGALAGLVVFVIGLGMYIGEPRRRPMAAGLMASGAVGVMLAAAYLISFASAMAH